MTDQSEILRFAQNDTALSKEVPCKATAVFALH
jgi:hypothetical protein